MHIALISPRGDIVKSNLGFKEFIFGSDFGNYYRRNFSGITPGLFILAALTPPGIDVEVIDENTEEINFNRPYDLVGITAMTQQAVRAYAIATEFRRRKVTTVIGGIHATLLPDEAKQYADCVVVGEAEYLWPLVIKDFTDGVLEPLYRNPEPVQLKDSPVPRYDIVKHKTKNHIVWVQSTRGCPHDCEFCCASKIFGRTYRYKPIEQVMAEISFIQSHYPSFLLHFSDDNLMGNKAYLKVLLEHLATRKLSWFGQSDISVAADDGILLRMQKSGCYCIFIGFETLTADGLKGIDSSSWKYRHLDNYKSYVAKIQSHGIGVRGAFILGLDQDTTASFNRIRDFIIETNMYESQITIATPLPGTRLRQRLERDRRLLSTPWDNYTFCDVNFIHNTLSKQELEEGLTGIYKEIHTAQVYQKKMRYFKEIQKQLLFIP